jgi:hypothetical protein
MSYPSRPSGTKDQPGKIEEEKMEEEKGEEEKEEEEEEDDKETASTTTSYEASNIPRQAQDSVENRPSVDGRSPLPGGNVNGRSPLPKNSIDGNSYNGEPAGCVVQVAGWVHTEDHQRLDAQFRELRGMLPSAAGRSLAASEQANSGGASSQGGGHTADTWMEDDAVDLLNRARRHILALEREQMLLAEQNHQLESLWEEQNHQQHEAGRADEQDEA